MKKILAIFLCFISAMSLSAQQKKAIDKVKFFEEDKILKATLSTNMNKLLGGKGKEGDSTSGNFTFFFTDSNAVKENITVTIRGNFRRKNCFIAPVRIEFRKPNSTYAALGSLKLVSACKTGDQYEDYLLAEYLIYKIYNLFTEKSFRIRLLELTYHDSTNRRKDFTNHAFLIEDSKDMARRNKMAEWKNPRVLTEQTDREQMTLVAIFEYMIGNTDWSVPALHNIRLICDKAEKTPIPYAVPYDFDYCGLVNAEYAEPYEELGIENIRQRLYRGYPRTMEELNRTLQVFKGKKEKIYGLVSGFTLLGKTKQREIINYLDEFYDIISRPKDVESIFIKNARKD
ncbi:MAG: hypothetical protein HYR66_18935 [Sphingobacteriales bacterium]|nr:hypothetical protein [Sphingobacteriales bacterium]MBI3717869.1 hypothetical protein [Sphingobacteriales bacterium]